MKSIFSNLQQDYCFLLIVLAIGFFIRLDFLIASDFVIDSDEAIVGLMAKHIREFKAFPIFYYGQHYMGSLEALMVALVSVVTGLNNYALKTVPLLATLFFILIVYLITLEVFNKKAARISALLSAISPVAFIIWSTKARGGFIELIVIGGLALLVLIRALKYRQVGFSSLFLISFLLGLGWWVNNQIIYFMLPVFLVLLGFCSWNVRPVKLLQYFTWSLFSFLLGSLPFWIYNFLNNWASFGIFTAAKEGETLDHLEGLYNESLPIILGARKFWSFTDNFSEASNIVLGIYIFIFLIYLASRFTQILKIFIFKYDENSPQEIFLLLMLTIVAVFVSSSYGHLSEAPRYLLPFYLPLFVISGGVIAFLWNKIRVTGIVLLLLVLGVNLLSCYFPKRQLMGEPFVHAGQRVSHDQTELINWLKQNKYSWVRTNYWIGYRLAFETQEEIRFLMFSSPMQVRIHEYESSGKKYAHSAPLVLVPEQARQIKLAFDFEGYQYKETKLSNYVVIYDYRLKQEFKKINPKIQEIRVPGNPELAKLMIDGDTKTRWGSGRPQSKDMQIKIVFNSPQLLSAIVYELALWPHDYPRELKVIAVLEDNKREVLLKPLNYKHLQYALEGDSSMRIAFDPVTVKELILKQTGADPVFDWSVAEIEFYQ